MTTSLQFSSREACTLAYEALEACETQRMNEIQKNRSGPVCFGDQAAKVVQDYKKAYENCVKAIQECKKILDADPCTPHLSPNQKDRIKELHLDNKEETEAADMLEGLHVVNAQLFAFIPGRMG